MSTTEIQPHLIEKASRLIADVELQSRNRDLGGFQATITKCLAPPKVIHEVVSMPTFWPSVKTLFKSLPTDNDAATSLAIAEIGRLHSTLKSRAGPLPPLASYLLERGTPSHFCFGDADQAAFAAKGWACSGRPIDVAVAARTIVKAEAPKPVSQWLELVVSEADVSTVIEHITAELIELDPEDAKSRSKRLQRILKALRSSIDPDHAVLGERITAAVADFVSKAFRKAGRPEQYGPSAKPAEDLMTLVLHLIRMDLRLWTEPGVYKSVTGASGWLPDGGWLRFTKSANGGAGRLRRILLDALVTLLKQHNPNRALLQCHRMLAPDPKVAMAELRSRADADRDIPPDERQWLASGGERSVPQEERRVSETDDVAIAMALLAVDPLVSKCRRLEGHADASELVAGVREAHNRVLTVANRRNLRAFGELGEVVRFSPRAHKLAASREVAPDRVRIVRSGVESQGSFGTRVVVPAIVTAL